jgi:hypothetical protein
MGVLLLVTYGAILLVDAVSTLDDCVYYQEVAAGQSFDVFSPNYPNNYPSGISCSWEAVAPSNSHFILQCNDFSLPAVSAVLLNVITPLLRYSPVAFYANFK